jgi:TrmH family RNA methyltransferase
MLTKNRIKYLRSLALKKYRDRYKEYIVEGEKIAGELIKNKYPLVRQLIASEQWLQENHAETVFVRENICTANYNELAKISSLKTPGKVIAVLGMPEHVIDRDSVINGLSLVLDTIQDPGNLGNIIRIADWFGIRNVFCSGECADCYNPKVVQSTMGSILRVSIHYVDLKDFLKDYSSIPGFTIYGTFLSGKPVYGENLAKNAFIVLGNESRGISKRYFPYIKTRLFIPQFGRKSVYAESLNVAAAAAIICSEFRRR